MNSQQTSRAHPTYSLTPFIVALTGMMLLAGCGQMLVTEEVDAAIATTDGGRDGGRDGGGDGGGDFDASLVGSDGGIHADIDSGIDASVDAGLDAGRDSGLDAGRDSGLDASFDAGRDASMVDASMIDASMVDAGRDAGMRDASMRDASMSDAGMVDGGLISGGVNLGAAHQFAILAGATVTSTGFTEVTGDIGLTPGSATSGFPPGVVNGMIRIGGPETSAAALALTDAYNDAAARSLPAPILRSGDLGGMTLAPGIYVSGTSMEITLADLTLDAGGDPNAVWIFQIASSFTATSGRQVILSGGARAQNVYWQVGSSATLGTTTRMVGNFLVDQSITLETGALLEGRALTRIGAVTLDDATVTLPTP